MRRGGGVNFSRGVSTSLEINTRSVFPVFHKKKVLGMFHFLKSFPPVTSGLAILVRIFQDKQTERGDREIEGYKDVVY